MQHIVIKSGFCHKIKCHPSGCLKFYDVPWHKWHMLCQSVTSVAMKTSLLICCGCFNCKYKCYIVISK